MKKIIEILWNITGLMSTIFVVTALTCPAYTVKMLNAIQILIARYV
jgi:hypothetical protein